LPHSKRVKKELKLQENTSIRLQITGEENLYAFVDETAGFVLTDTSGYILALCDKNGISKAIVQGVTKEQKESIEKILKDDNIPEYKGKVSLPV